MTQKILSFIFVCVAVMSPAAAQKELKALRAFVKAKNTSEAMKEVARLEADSICQYMPKLYELAVKAQIQINDIENEKAYLKKECDTAKLFESTRQIFHYVHKCDSVERLQMEFLGKKHELDYSKVKLLQRYYKNLEAGTRYFYSRKKYPEAQRHLHTLLHLSKSPLWVVTPVDTLSKEHITNAYMYTYSAFTNKDYAEVERYKHLLLSDEDYYATALEMYARTANDRGRSASFEKYLERGVATLPLHDYFFEELATLYTADERYAQCVSLADQRLAADANCLKAMYLKAFSLYQLEEEKACIEVSKQLVAADTAHLYADANFYAGELIMNELQTIYLPTRIRSKAFEEAKREMKRVCSEALPYLERYRKLCPSQREKWAPLLYRIYLELNMGPEFEEISTYM